MSDFRMPAVKCGQKVWFYPDCHLEGTPTMGFVHQAGDSAIEILTFDVRGESPRMNVRVCVHHADDPVTRKESIRPYGCWRHHPDEMAIRNLMETQVAMQQQIDVLSKELARRKA